jgi:outer membrane protein OmpA-like peptidoglycan-associated protein
LVILALCLSGCVSQARHDDVASQLERATTDRDAEKRKAADLDVQLAELHETAAELKKQLAAGDAALTGEREQLARVRFEADVIDRERDEAKRMSEQLLVELERVSLHLRAFADDKEGLARELERARDRLAALALDEKASQQRFLTARQLTLALAEPLEHEKVRLTLVDGNIAIQFPRSTAFDGDGSALSKGGKAVLQKTADVVTPLQLSVLVEQPTSATSRAERAKSVSDALVSFGLASNRVIAPDVASTTAAAADDPDSEDTLDAAEPVAQAPEISGNGDGDTELELLLRFESTRS